MTRRMWMALLSLAGLFLGAYLTLYKIGIIGTLACGVTSCETVQTSRWSVFLGVPVATWGVGFYALMLALVLAGLQPRFAESRPLATTVLALASWGVLFTAWLNYLEAFVIHAWCEWCLGSAAMVVVLFLLALVDWRDTRAAANDGGAGELTRA
ncbi:MAG TPA: vitamin K epoxide reductase family protein [Gemmatimonadaceae bacterium]|nr:vitamin K epoxide reductase family protein [Gemmatimonadaceae bacterium]